MVRPSLGTWTKDEVLTMVYFVIDNGYIQKGHTILKQVKGFGMGLACAPQIANLGCYPVERDFSKDRASEEVEHNYRFLDDILTLSGCIPSPEQYGMQYKDTKSRERNFIYLGMELSWVPWGNSVKFITGMHFREAAFECTPDRVPWLQTLNAWGL